LSATSSNIGLQKSHKPLIGGAAILTSGLWSSKVSQSSQDLFGNGLYTITTIQGKGNKKISFIAAYIVVSKGSNIGVDSLYAQQTTLYEKT